MPSVAEIKNQLKLCKIKGITGKTKAQLFEMLPEGNCLKFVPVKKARAAKPAPEPAPVPIKAPAPAPAPAPKKVEKEKSTKYKNIPDKIASQLLNNAWIKKAYPTDAGNLLDKIDDIISGKEKEDKYKTREFGFPVFDLGTFASSNWKNNAVGVKTPKTVDKLISKLGDGAFSLYIYNDEDDDTFMVLTRT